MNIEPRAVLHRLTPVANVANGADFRSALFKRAILNHDYASFGLPNFLRIATRKPEENRRLLQTLKENIA